MITLKVDDTDLWSERVPLTVTVIVPTLATAAVLQSNVLLLGVLNVTGVAGTAENEYVKVDPEQTVVEKSLNV